MLEETVYGPERRRAENAAGRTAAPAENCVQIVLYKHKPWIFNTTIEIVIIAITVCEGRFAVIEQSIKRKETQPVVHIGDAFNFLDINVIRCLGHNRAEIHQARPVVLGLIGLLEVAVAVRVGIRSPVLQVGRAEIPHTFIRVAVGIVRKMVAGKVTVDDFDLYIGAVHALPGLGQVLPVDPDLHRHDVGLRLSVELKKLIACQLVICIF